MAKHLRVECMHQSAKSIHLNFWFVDVVPCLLLGASRRMCIKKKRVYFLKVYIGSCDLITNVMNFDNKKNYQSIVMMILVIGEYEWSMQ